MTSGEVTSNKPKGAGTRRTGGRSTRKEDNPVGNLPHVQISYPKFQIRLVNASGLTEYEIWVFITTAMTSLATGFWVAYFTVSETDARHGLLHAISLLFTVLAVIALVITVAKERTLRQTGATYDGSIGALTPVEDDMKTQKKRFGRT